MNNEPPMPDENQTCQMTADRVVNSVKKARTKRPDRTPIKKGMRRLFQIAPGRFMVRDCKDDQKAFESMQRLKCPCGDDLCLLFPEHLQCSKGCKTKLTKPVIDFLAEIQRERRTGKAVFIALPDPWTESPDPEEMRRSAAAKKNLVF